MTTVVGLTLMMVGVGFASADSNTDKHRERVADRLNIMEHPFDSILLVSLENLSYSRI